MSITITERAATEVIRTREEQTEETPSYLRIGVAAGGCSGFSYELFFDGKFSEDNDQKYEQHGVTVIVDKKSALYLEGTTLDYIHEMNQRGFVFQNPNATKSCGCGSSFQV
jgi:iron-sulfur cluster assembly protein